MKREISKETAVSETDKLLEIYPRYAESFDGGKLHGPPARRLAVVACMDARLDVYRILGLEPGDAHVITERERSRQRRCD